MDENNLNFITISHEGHSHTVRCSAKQINKFYPDSDFYIYDQGLSHATRQQLRSIPNTNLIDWTDESDFESTYGAFRDKLASLEYELKDTNIIDRIVNNLFGYGYTNAALRDDFIFRQKPLTIRDLSKKVVGNIFWLDSDVILVNRVDELFNLEYDVAGTTRSKYEENRTNLPLNAGVLVFNTNSEKIQGFVNEWMGEIEKLEFSRRREQLALINTFEKSSGDIFSGYYNAGELEAKSSIIETFVIPTSVYNYHTFNNGINPNKHKILHFRGGRADNGFNKSLISDIRKGNIDNWYKDNIDPDL